MVVDEDAALSTHSGLPILVLEQSLSSLFKYFIHKFLFQISQLVRRPLLLEKAIFSLGISMAVLDCKYIFRGHK